MMARNEELEAFKSEINFSEFAASCGYVLDSKSSSRNSAVMRDGKGDKIILARGTDRHWIYFSINDSMDNGTVIDFLQNRGGGNLGEIRKTLRGWISGSGRAQNYGGSEGAGKIFAGDLEPISKDLARVRADFYRCIEVTTYPYLENLRKIPKEVLGSEKFRGRIFLDERQNTIFPHWNQEGISGFEIKNENFTGFSSGGDKGLWCSRATGEDTTLVITETAIDALSYEALKSPDHVRYVSTGGKLNSRQGELLKSAFLKLPKNGQVILALDHDDGGDQLRAEIEEIFSQLEETSLILKTDRPETRGKDWNDVLRQKP